MRIPPARNPALSLAINPFVASSLNPIITASLNPSLTVSKNPFVSASLNPNITSSHNPKIATGLNYQITASLNPVISPGLNPRISLSKNPNHSLSISGLYIWDLNLNPIGFTVQANDRVSLTFTPSAEFLGVLIQVHEEHLNQFDLHNEWNEYWLHAKDRTWLRYTLMSEWIGFTT